MRTPASVAGAGQPEQGKSPAPVILASPKNQTVAPVIGVDPMRSRELAAQETMADTAVIMTVVAALTLLATTVGTISI